MTRRLVLVATLALATVAVAEPHKVYVLPLDGAVDAATKQRLDASVQKLAGASGNTVTTGHATFNDTATAVGCDPSTPACVDTVMQTLDTDELVWGQASDAGGTTTLVVKRTRKGEPPREQTTTFTTADPPDKAETGLGPLFSDAPAAGSGSGSGSAPSEPAQPWSQDRKLGVGLAAGGGAVLLVGFALWANANSMQNTINNHATNTLADIQDLKNIENSAANSALWGNVLVVVGAAVGGVGAYYLWKDHRVHASASVAPVDKGTGAAVVVGGAW